VRRPSIILFLRTNCANFGERTAPKSLDIFDFSVPAKSKVSLTTCGQITMAQGVLLLAYKNWIRK